MAANLTIRFAPGLRAKMLVSVGRWLPEHYALLSGRLEDPFRILDFMPMPPARDRSGNSLAGPTSVTLNANFIEYYLNMCLLPFGMNILGIMHSHPGTFSCLSNGISGSGQGDLPSMRGQLEKAKEQGVAWENYLAPIVTEPGSDPKVTGWIVRLDEPQPLPATVIFEGNALSGTLRYSKRWRTLSTRKAPTNVRGRR